MMKFLARLLLRIFGWTLNEQVPQEAQRCIMTAAPHTTNWDYIITRMAFFVLGIPVKIAIKDYWTRFPFGLVVRPLGGLGIDRSPKDPSKPRKSQTEQMAAFFKQYEKIAIVIAPEGSRTLRKQWKLGFYHAACIADVPITFGYLDYSKKIAGVGGALHPTGDIEKDMPKLLEFYSTITGKYPSKFMLDERFPIDK